MAQALDDYVYLDRAQAMQARLREQLASGAYDGITDPAVFAERLTHDLWEVVDGDKHLGVVYQASRSRAEPGPPPSLERYGYPTVELRDDGIGYIDVRGFWPPRLAEQALADAMTKVVSADALILDLRNNGGGEPDGVVMFASYLLPQQRIHFDDLVFRADDRVDSYYTSPKTRGPWFGTSKPVVLLTSASTRSAGEEFAYGLRAQERVTIVGETTAGAGHLSRFDSLDDPWGVYLPIGLPRNPLTGGGWEGTGVEPDVAVPASGALERAVQWLGARDQ